MSDIAAQEKTLSGFNVGDDIYFFQFVMGDSLKGMVQAATRQHLVISFGFCFEHVLDRNSFYGRTEKELCQKYVESLRKEVIKLTDEKQRKEERVEVIEKYILGLEN